MKVYDAIGAEYRDWRSADIGVTEISDLVHEIGARAVLDLGCGNGFPIAEAVAPLVDDYVGVDSSGVLLDEFKANLPAATAILSPIESVDLADQQFDLVFSFGCIFHLTPEAQRDALGIASGAVKSGGVLTFNSGTDEGYTTGHVGGHELDHWSLGEPAYIELLTNHGLNYRGSQMGRGQNLFFTFKKP